MIMLPRFLIALPRISNGNQLPPTTTTITEEKEEEGSADESWDSELGKAQPKQALSLIIALNSKQSSQSSEARSHRH